MKLILTILFFFVFLNANAWPPMFYKWKPLPPPATYYVKTGGSDGAAGTSPATAWATVSKVNSTIAAGDTVYFNRGDTFSGSLTPPSGTSGAYTYIGAYGTGAKPIITGLTTLSGWTNLGGNKWEKAVNSGTDLELVLLNGVFTACGRWPDFNEVDTELGYQIYDNGGNTGTLTDNQLVSGSGVSDWTGASVVVRTEPWELDESVITAQSGNIINFSPALSQPTRTGNGYFITKDPRTVNRPGEWYYTPSTKIMIYSLADPGSTVKVATQDYGCYLNGKSYVNIDGLRFEGFDKAGVYLVSTNFVKIQNNEIDWSGEDGVSSIIDFSWSPQDNLIVTGNTIFHCNNTGINLNNFPQNNPDHTKIQSTYAHNTKVTNNTVKYCGLTPGAGVQSGDQYNGIYVKSDSAYVVGNIVDSVGSSTLTVSHSRAYIVQHNFCKHYNLLCEDIGGIYSSHVGDNDEKTGPGLRLIEWNIVDNYGVNGRATKGLADKSGHERDGYLDETTDHVIMQYNTFANCNDAAAEMHRINYVNFQYNTLFNAKHQQLYMLTQNAGETFTGMRIVGNIFFSKTRDQHNMDFINWNDDAAFNWTANGGLIDSNYYINPYRYGLWMHQINGIGERRHWDKVSWNNAYGHDAHSSESPIKFQAYKATNVGSNKSTVSSYVNSNYSDNQSIGAITAGKKYQLKFIASSAIHQGLRFQMFDNSSTFARSDEVYARLNTNPGSLQDSVILTCTQSEASAKLWIYNQNPIAHSITGITLFEVNVIEPEPDDSIYFAYNASNSPITINFPGSHYWKDAKNVRYPDTAVLQPWTSIIGMMDTGTIAANIPPVVSAGVDKLITLPTNLVSVTGTATDADGTIASRLWSQISGPATVGFSAATSNTTNVTGLTVAGVYQIKFTATDNLGASTSDTMQITVNIAPIANAGSDIIVQLPTTSTTLNGSGSSDPDGTISTYAWVKLTGTGGSITSASSASTGVTGLSGGSYTYKLTVTDNNGATSTDTVQVIVNVQPVANAGSDQTIQLPTSSVTVNASSSTDADGTIVTYAWSKISGPSTFNIVSPSSASTVINTLVQGTYVFRVTVTDNNGGTGTDDIQIIVQAAANIPPVASAGENGSITLPTATYQLDGSNSFDSDGTIASYAWTKLSGPTYSINNAAIVNPVLSALVAGVYVFRLTVTDNNGASDAANVTITVNAAPSSGTATFRVKGNIKRIVEQ